MYSVCYLDGAKGVIMLYWLQALMFLGMVISAVRGYMLEKEKKWINAMCAYLVGILCMVTFIATKYVPGG